MNKIHYEIKAAVRHGIDNPSPAYEAQMIQEQNLFYASALFTAIQQLSETANGGWTSVDNEEIFESIEKLAELGQSIVQYTFGSGAKINRLSIEDN